MSLYKDRVRPDEHTHVCPAAPRAPERGRSDPRHLRHPNKPTAGQIHPRVRLIDCHPPSE